MVLKNFNKFLRTGRVHKNVRLPPAPGDTVRGVGEKSGAVVKRRECFFWNSVLGLVQLISLIMDCCVFLCVIFFFDTVVIYCGRFLLL